MANILLKIGKGVEVGAEDLLKWAVDAQKDAPGALAALGVLAGAVEVALSDTAAIVANPASLVITLSTDVKDFAATWTDAKAFLASLGVKA